jgi:hypothetical protein
MAPVSGKRAAGAPITGSTEFGSAPPVANRVHRQHLVGLLVLGSGKKFAVANGMPFRHWPTPSSSTGLLFSCILLFNPYSIVTCSSSCHSFEPTLSQSSTIFTPNFCQSLISHLPYLRRAIQLDYLPQPVPPSLLLYYFTPPPP